MVRKIPLLLISLAFACGDDAPTPDDEQQQEEEANEAASDASARDARTQDTANTRDASSARDAASPARDANVRDADREEEEEDASVDAATDAGTDARASDPGAGDDCDVVSYAAFAQSFFKTYCISCHGKMEPTFNDLDEIEPHLEEIRERVFDPPAPALQMPPSGSKQPSAADKKKLEQWLDCDAP